jgi:hypothetical protein
MPRYLLEAYVPDSTSALGSAREGAERTASLGEGIRHVRTTFLPDDQLVQHVFEAPSAAALRRAGTRAALQYERLVEAFEQAGADGGPVSDDTEVSHDLVG